MVLLQIALLAGPAIAVGARRNQHTLALLAATGAHRRHLRTVVLATNGVIGLVSCTVAAGLGTLLGMVIIAVLRAHDVSIVRIDVHSVDLLVLVGVGVLTSLGASLIPARQAAKLDVVAALTGRRGYSPPALRVPVLGLVLVAVGTGLAVFTSKADLPFVTVLGLGLAEVGLVAASGAIVALAARLAVHLPFSARFALRDAARQRSRTAPAVAAVLAAIAGGSAALVFMAAQEDYDHRNYRPAAASGVIAVDAITYSFDDAEPSLPRAEALLRKELPIGTLQPFRTPKSADDGVDVVLNPLLPPGFECPPLATLQGGVSISVSPSSVPDDDLGPCPGRSEPGTIDFEHGNLFDDGTALQVLTDGAAPAAAAALKAGRVVTTDPEVIWPDGKVHLSVERWSDDGQDDTRTTVALDAVPWPSGDQKLTGLVYPSVAAGKLGLELETSGFLADTTRSVSKGQEERVNDLLHTEAGVQMEVERGYVSSYTLGLLALLVAAAVVSLVGTFTAVGLAAAESRADLSTLAAVGAGPGVRRRLAAAQAGVISGLGGVLGVVSGILAGWVLIRMQHDWSSLASDEELWRLVLPWRYLLGVGLGIPLLAMLIAFATTRSRLTVVRRPGQ
nr:FtsX-like permease family protein [Kineosporia mesophila]